jgi:hypothetical protein
MCPGWHNVPAGSDRVQHGNQGLQFTRQLKGHNTYRPHQKSKASMLAVHPMTHTSTHHSAINMAHRGHECAAAALAALGVTPSSWMPPSSLKPIAPPKHRLNAAATATRPSA